MPDSNSFIGMMTGAFVVLALGVLVWGWRYWFTSIPARLEKHGDRLDAHGLKIAVVSAQMENITALSTETRNDVKELLRYANGGNKRSGREG